MRNMKDLGYLLLIPFLTIAYNCSDDHDHDHDSTDHVTTIIKHFTDNESTSVTNVYSEADSIYIESYGIPDHPTTDGIIAWNQRVPAPQDFTGDNAFQLPADPEIADSPSYFHFNGAVEIALNGVPIFDPFKQNICSDSGQVDDDCVLTSSVASTGYDQYDAYLSDELDECGGHSGRGDDYHYHVYPSCLGDELNVQGLTDHPFAYAMDGYPIYAPALLTDEPSFEDNPLDELNGHTLDDEYHYHANFNDAGRPYVIGGFKGRVTINIDDDRTITHEPHTQSPRGGGNKCFEDEPFRDEDGLEFSIGTDGYHTLTLSTPVTISSSGHQVQMVRYRYDWDTATNSATNYEWKYYSSTNEADEITDCE